MLAAMLAGACVSSDTEIDHNVNDKNSGTAAFRVFEDHCVDPIQTTGKPVIPGPGSGWRVATATERDAADARHPGAQVMVREDPDAGEILVYQYVEKVEAGVSGPDRLETRQLCRVNYFGEISRPDEGAHLYTLMKEKLDGVDGGTSIGSIRACSQDILESKGRWNQWVWSTYHKRFRPYWTFEPSGNRGNRSGCVRATTDRFYAATELVHVLLRLREDRPNTAILDLRRTFRPKSGGPERTPRVTIETREGH